MDRKFSKIPIYPYLLYLVFIVLYNEFVQSVTEIQVQVFFSMFFSIFLMSKERLKLSSLSLIFKFFQRFKAIVKEKMSYCYSVRLRSARLFVDTLASFSSLNKPSQQPNSFGKYNEYVIFDGHHKFQLSWRTIEPNGLRFISRFTLSRTKNTRNLILSRGYVKLIEF